MLQNEQSERNELNVQYLPTKCITPYENNPRIHQEKQVKQLVNSIREFDFTNPILVDENNVIIAGHGRLLAAQSLEMERVPVVKITHFSEMQKRAYRIADNKLTENGQWDVDLLRLEFAELEKLELDFSLKVTGFDTADIDLMLDQSLKDKSKEVQLDKKANAVPFISKDEVITQVGDLWLLGKHRLVCGDALDANSFGGLFDMAAILDTPEKPDSSNSRKEKREKSGKAAMIFTDPPYNVPVDGHVCGNGRFKHSEFKMASGEMSSAEFQRFLYTNFEMLKTFSKNGALVYICMDWRHIKETINAGSEVFDDFKNLCVWNKDNGGMGSLYRSKHELVFVFKNGKASHKNNVELGSHGRYRTNVWDYPGLNSFSGDHKNLRMHPTVKPVEMIRDAILDVTDRGDVVLDCFLGSGSTLIAAEKAGRICYGIEIEPLYIDTAIRRWQELTGKSAVHEKTSKTYREMLEAHLCKKAS